MAQASEGSLVDRECILVADRTGIVVQQALHLHRFTCQQRQLAARDTCLAQGLRVARWRAGPGFARPAGPVSPRRARFHADMQVDARRINEYVGQRIRNSGCRPACCAPRRCKPATRTSTTSRALSSDPPPGSRPMFTPRTSPRRRRRLPRQPGRPGPPDARLGHARRSGPGTLGPRRRQRQRPPERLQHVPVAAPQRHAGRAGSGADCFLGS